MDEFLIIFATVFLLPTTIIFLKYYYKDRERKQRFQLFHSALEKGATLPLNLFDEPKAVSQEGYGKLAWGLVSTLIGVAAVFGLPLIADNENMEEVLGLMGLAPLSVGLGLLIAFFVQRAMEKRDVVKEKPKPEYIRFASPAESKQEPATPATEPAETESTEAKSEE